MTGITTFRISSAGAILSTFRICAASSTVIPVFLVAKSCAARPVVPAAEFCAASIREGFYLSIGGSNVGSYRSWERTFCGLFVCFYEGSAEDLSADNGNLGDEFCCL